MGRFGGSMAKTVLALFLQLLLLGSCSAAPAKDHKNEAKGSKKEPQHRFPCSKPLLLKRALKENQEAADNSGEAAWKDVWSSVHHAQAHAEFAVHGDHEAKRDVEVAHWRAFKAQDDHQQSVVDLATASAASQIADHEYKQYKAHRRKARLKQCRREKRIRAHEKAKRRAKKRHLKHARKKAAKKAEEDQEEVDDQESRRVEKARRLAEREEELREKASEEASAAAAAKELARQVAREQRRAEARARAKLIAAQHAQAVKAVRDAAKAAQTLRKARRCAEIARRSEDDKDMQRANEAHSELVAAKAEIRRLLKSHRLKRHINAAEYACTLSKDLRAHRARKRLEAHHDRRILRAKAVLHAHHPCSRTHLGIEGNSSAADDSKASKGPVDTPGMVVINMDSK